MTVARGHRRRVTRWAGLLLVAAALLVGCDGSSSGQGTLSGHLYAVGGPARQGVAASPRPLAGTVVAKGPGGAHTATAGSDGRYTMQLPAGTYKVTATSPLYGGGHSTCPARGTVTVSVGQESTVDIHCQVR